MVMDYAAGCLLVLVLAVLMLAALLALQLVDGLV